MNSFMCSYHRPYLCELFCVFLSSLPVWTLSCVRIIPTCMDFFQSFVCSYHLWVNSYHPNLCELFSVFLSSLPVSTPLKVHIISTYVYFFIYLHHLFLRVHCRCSLPTCVYLFVYSYRPYLCELVHFVCIMVTCMNSFVCSYCPYLC